MLAKVYSYAISGLEAYPITIEVDVSKGLPCTIIVGLPDNAVRESKERVLSAIKNSGYKYPSGRKTINLSPADIKKEGPSFDLAIAIGLLAASNQINIKALEKYVMLGELSLDGQIKPVYGTLCVALSLMKDDFKGFILPSLNAQEAVIAEDIPIHPMKNLNETVLFLDNSDSVAPYKIKEKPSCSKPYDTDIDFEDVKGQMHVKRGLEIGAAGGHNVLLIGPPGSGKSMLAKRLVTILPEMSKEESIQTTKIHSVCGLLDHKQGLLSHRPFRSPHHTTSAQAIVGGGRYPKPGEVSISHNGVLFLDELPEFNRNVLESLRQPLEDNYVTISRSKKTVRFPSKFMLICAMNPCPCGFYTDKRKRCTCSPNQRQRYMMRISGPLLDRIDLHLEVPALDFNEMLYTQKAESSQEIKTRTIQVRSRQQQRFRNTEIFTNANMPSKQIKEFCALNKDSKDLLKMAIEELALSARAYDKILKVARTISDLAESETIQPDHIAEAIQYRSLDRGWWG